MNSQPSKVTNIKNFLSEEDYSKIYETVNRCIKENVENGRFEYDEPFKIINKNGFFVLLQKNFDPALLDSMQNTLSEKLGVSLIEFGFLFARYTTKTGINPKLLPHVDRVVDRPAVSGTIELDSTLDWDIYLNETKHNLDKNEILIFSGSNDIHWRPDIDFSENDYFDIMIVHSYVDTELVPVFDDEHFEKMHLKAIRYFDKYNHLLRRGLEDAKRENEPEHDH